MKLQFFNGKTELLGNVLTNLFWGHGFTRQSEP